MCEGVLTITGNVSFYRNRARTDESKAVKKCLVVVINRASLPLSVSFRYDYVEVRDGVDESGQLVGKYCGKIAPSPVVSSGNQLFIKFVSDYETHGAGFSIRYEIFKTGRWLSFLSDAWNFSSI